MTAVALAALGGFVCGAGAVALRRFRPVGPGRTCEEAAARLLAAGDELANAVTGADAIEVSAALTGWADARSEYLQIPR